MIICKTDRLRIRNWRNEDIDLMHVINSDDEVMAFFPNRRDRQQSLEMLQRARDIIARTGYGFFALELKRTGEPIGFAGLSVPELQPVLPEDTVEIGWRLARPHWGQGYASEAARELLRLGFDERGLEEIVSFAVFNNHRSLAVMRRIGMTHDPTRDFDHPRVPDTHPELRRHVLYAISGETWRQTAQSRSQSG